MCKALKVSSFDESTLRLFVEKIDVTCIGKQKLEILLEQLNAEVIHVSYHWPLGHYSKTCFKWSFKMTEKLFFKTEYRLMQVKSVAECSKGSILQYFWPSLSYYLSLRSLFCLFLSGCLRDRCHMYWKTEARNTSGTAKRRGSTCIISLAITVKPFISGHS